MTSNKHVSERINKGIEEETRDNTRKGRSEDSVLAAAFDKNNLLDRKEGTSDSSSKSSSEIVPNKLSKKQRGRENVNEAGEKNEPKASIIQLFRYTTTFDKSLLLMGSIVAIITGLGTPLLSVIFGRVSQNFMNVNGKTMTVDQFNDAVIKNSYEYLCLGVIVFVAGAVQTICFLVVCENMENRLRREFFYAILRQDITWFDTNHSGTLATKLFDNLERIKEGTGDKLGLMIQFMGQFFGGFAVAFFFDWRLTLVMLSLTPLIIGAGAFLAKLMASAASREAKKYAVSGGIAEEVLTSIRTVIAFNGQPHESNRYEQSLADARSTGIKKSILIGIGLAFTFVVLFATYSLAFWVGTNFVYNGDTKGGTVMTVFVAVMMGSLAIGQAGPQFAVIGTAMGAAGAVYEVIDREPEIDSYSTEGEEPEQLEGNVCVLNADFNYPARPNVKILQDVSFHANPGETVALVGSSGSGKSTIIQLLLRYYNPKSGTITIGGIRIDELNVRYLRNYIGVVSQEPVLFNTTIEENIRYGRRDVTEEEIAAALKKANAYEFVMSFPDGIRTNVGDRGAQMSGGQKQRIAITRALVRDPQILLLDEATSALDAESESIVQHALDKASRGRTTIVVAHRLSTIRNADRIVVMKGGKIMEVGRHDDLMGKKGLYYELVNAQVFADVERKLEEEGAVKANLCKLLRYARPERPFIALGVISSIFEGSVFPIFSLCFSQIIDVFSLKPGDPELKSEGHFWALMFLVLGLAEGTTLFLRCYFFGYAAEHLTMRIRLTLFRNILRMDGTYFDMPRHSPGKLTTRLATDASNVKSALDFRFGTVFTTAVTITIGVALAFYFGWQMALLAVVIFPTAALVQAAEVRYAASRAKADAKEMENSGKVAMEAIENIRTVQALTLEPTMFEKFCHHLTEPHQTSKRKAVIHGIAFGVSCSTTFFLYAISYRFGAWLITNNYLSPMNVLRSLFAISFTAGSLGYASAYFPEYIKATFAAGLIFSMLDEEPQIDGMTDEGEKPQISGSIAFEGVYFKYPQRPRIPILRGLNVSIKPGQTLALVGPSGCGKSTAISLLERLYDPLDGVVRIDGIDSRRINPTHLRSSIALVSQEPILFDRSIRDNITYGLPPNSVSDEEIYDVARRANIHEFIMQLPDKYDTHAGDKGTQLSGGQKQRIAIARALVRNPKILLLDEATSALDAESEKVVRDALEKASKGRTCVIVAHRLSTVVNATCIVVIKKGKVIEQGTHLELMAARGAYWKLTQKQMASKK
ncbi:hypothetical protein Q1695_007198 [Nippostrongylus brasiliensis]|nr:hypothetical protein Q1695_007198 [Nippostrongylus brasiliensis]